MEKEKAEEYYYYYSSICPVCGYISSSTSSCYNCEKEEEREPDWIEKAVGKKQNPKLWWLLDQYKKSKCK